MFVRLLVGWRPSWYNFLRNVCFLNKSGMLHLFFYTMRERSKFFQDIKHRTINRGYNHKLRMFQSTNANRCNLFTQSPLHRIFIVGLADKYKPSRCCHTRERRQNHTLALSRRHASELDLFHHSAKRLYAYIRIACMFIFAFIFFAPQAMAERDNRGLSEISNGNKPWHAQTTWP